MNLIPWRNKGSDRGGEQMETSITRFRDEMENLFDRFFRDDWGQSVFDMVPARFGWGPRVDLVEADDKVTLKVELPGVDPKDVDIDVAGNVLTIRGEKRNEWQDKHTGYQYVERHFGTFQRRIQLPSFVDSDKVDAVYKDGILTVTLPKRADAKTKKITVRNA